MPLAADRCRDARGIGLVEDLTRDIVYAFRRGPLTAITIVATVALGLGLVTAVFTIYNTILFRADAVRNPDELFVVEPRLSLSGERVPLTRVDYEALRRETSVFTDAVALQGAVDVATVSRIDRRPAVGSLVSGNFFRTLGVQSASAERSCRKTIRGSLGVP